MIDYRSAGVNIEAGNEIVRQIKQSVQNTFNPHVLGGLGGFSALYDLQAIMREYQEPVLVQSVDGVGTKTMIASLMGSYDGLGSDLLSATANDILVCGAKPLTLLDYVGGAELKPNEVVAIIESICKACTTEGVSLIGGETAEMPGVYASQEYTLVGMITGVVEKKQMITGMTIKPGDKVLGFASSGLHTNGYSLARKLCFDVAGLDVTSVVSNLGSRSIGEILLSPHLNYSQIVHELLASFPIKGMAHITGGGLLENIPRILPQNCSVDLTVSAWPSLPIFDYLLHLGDLHPTEAYRTFNMGIGYVLIVEKETSDDIMRHAANYKGTADYSLFEIGEVIQGQQEVHLL